MLNVAGEQPGTCVSELTLDEFRADELSRERAELVRDHLAGCARCRARAEALQRETAAIAATLPELRRQASPPARRSRWIAATSTLAAAAALLLVVRSPSPPPIDGQPAAPSEAAATPEPELLAGVELAERVKGGASVGFHVQRGEQIARGGPGEVLRPGDRVRFHYTSRERAHLAILSVDGAKNVSVYHPEGPLAEAIEPAEERSLATAIELDEVLGPEVIHAVFCRDPVQTSALTAALRARPTAPEFPASCSSYRLHLEKVAR